MAILTTTSVNGIISATGGVFPQGDGMTPWYRLYHCADATSTAICNPVFSCGWLHIRTPIPADAGSGEFSGSPTGTVGWNPSVLEVMGFHTYSGEHTHNFRAIVNTRGDGSNTFDVTIHSNVGSNSNPSVYRSNSTYGGKRRVCIAVNKIGCCCVGWIWVRWRANTFARADHPWATGANSSAAALY
jgi:hypothetical protein